MERVHIAQKADGETFAVLTDETSETTAQAIATAAAAENNASLIGLRVHRVVRPTAQAKAAGASSKLEER